MLQKVYTIEKDGVCLECTEEELRQLKEDIESMLFFCPAPKHDDKVDMYKVIGPGYPSITYPPATINFPYVVTSGVEDPSNTSRPFIDKLREQHPNGIPFETE